MNPSLYETDYHQWIEKTMQQLQQRNLENLDWDNLIEELESMGRNDKRALISLLTHLLEHLLKLAYWETEKAHNGNHWSAAIVNFRAQIQNRLEDSPSLKAQLPQFYAKAYPVALKSTAQLFPLPPTAQITLEQALNDDWFPNQ
ncbi:MAG: DUF29 domain-containing protein [Microcystaceae cyanobacterium]